MVFAPMTILSASFFLALSSVTFAKDYQVKNDAKIEAIALIRAAQQIGELRGTISFDVVPDFIERDDLKRKLNNVQDRGDLSPRPSWVPPTKDREFLPPLVTRGYMEGLDQTLTGSVKRTEKPRRNFEWEVFDKDGNLVILD